MKNNNPPRKIRSPISLLALLLMALAAAGCMDAKSTSDEVEARRSESPTLGRPTDVAVSAANRRLTISWREIPGATSYKIAVRPKNQLVPAWREYPAPSSPYTIANMWAMSGMQYEVRVAAVNTARSSEWSFPVPITAPVLQASSAATISSDQPLMGKFAKVSLESLYPFVRRSPWHWFMCNADGSDCKVLPKRRGRPSYQYFMEPELQGKCLSVQVDYDQGGVSYSATAVLGVVAAEASTTPLDGSRCGSPPPAPRPHPETLTTHLYDLQSLWVRLRWDRAWGGAIAPLGNDLLVATPHGRFALVSPIGEVAYLEGNVPMNKAELLAHPDQANFRSDRFRVADILLKRHSAGRYELFVTHHYFTGECLRFRLSATTLLQQGADVSVSSMWRTVFDAEPCLPTADATGGGDHAGGRMLTDGPDHLLVVTGDHGQGEYAQDPASHLGKLVRVEIETGRAETLAFGLRNPQGLIRDEAGHLWETEHGPQGGGELNLLVAGGNYGWPQVSYGVGYGSTVNVSRVSRAEAVGLHDGFIKPVFAWVPSIGISSVIVNDEHLFPLWRDDLLIGSLSGTQGSGHALFRVRRDSTDVQYVERIEVGNRVRDLAQMPDRRLALLVDEGWVHFLSRSYAHCADESKWNRNVYAIDCEDTVGTVAATGAQLYDAYCSGCHSLNVEKHGMGPHLVGVLERRAGAVSGYLFSDVLRSLDMVWTPADLERFLADPKQFAPGTSKESLDLTQAEIRAIADFIKGD